MYVSKKYKKLHAVFVKQLQEINVSQLTILCSPLTLCHVFIMVIIARVITIITWNLATRRSHMKKF